MTSLQYITDAERLLITPAIDQYIFTKDTKMLYYGDGITAGGKNTVKDEIANIFQTSVTPSSEIVFSYDSETQKISANFNMDLILEKLAPNVASKNMISILDHLDPIYKKTIVDLTSHFLRDLVQDINPTLGGDLELNGFNLTSSGDTVIRGNSYINASIINTDTITAATERVDIAGPLAIIGTNENNGLLYIENDGTADPIVTISNSNESQDGGTLVFIRSRGNYKEYAPLQNQDNIFNLAFAGRSLNNNPTIAAMISASVDKDVLDNSISGIIVFRTANQQGVLNESVTINSDGILTATQGVSIRANTTSTILSSETDGLIKTFVAETNNTSIIVENAGWTTSSGVITLAMQGQGCILQFVNSKWYCVGNNGGVFS